jgi:tetratricopeptide (TPR) repeat protein
VLFTRLYGPDHYEIAVNANNLAALLHARGAHPEAEPLYQRALAIKERLLGPQHPDVAMTLSNLAVLYAALGRYTDAEALYQRALPLFEQTLGPTHPHVQTCRQNYADYCAIRSVPRPVPLQHERGGHGTPAVSTTRVETGHLTAA